MTDSLVEKARAGNPDATEALVLKYQPDIQRFAHSLCATNEDAEDAVQHTLFVVLSKVGSFKGLSKFSTWLFAIVKNECLRLSKRARQMVVLSKDPIDPSQRVDEHVEVDELRQRVIRAINSLGSSHREVLLLRDIEGLDAEATARALGIKVDTMKTRLHRARQAVRRELMPFWRTLD